MPPIGAPFRFSVADERVEVKLADATSDAEKASITWLHAGSGDTFQGCMGWGPNRDTTCAVEGTSVRLLLPPGGSPEWLDRPEAGEGLAAVGIGRTSAGLEGKLAIGYYTALADAQAKLARKAEKVLQDQQARAGVKAAEWARVATATGRIEQETTFDLAGVTISEAWIDPQDHTVYQQATFRVSMPFHLN